MAWDDDDLSESIAELFGDFREFSPKADGLSIYQRGNGRPQGRPKNGKTPAEMSAYKAQKTREYYERDRNAPPTEATKEALRRRALERKIMRERMADSRSGYTHHFTIFAKCPKLKCVSGRVGDNPCSRCNGSGVREVDGYLTCNTYDDGRLGEIFIRIGKAGNEEAIYEQWAIGASMALQFGVPVEAYFRKFLATQFEPAGATKNKDIKRCTSILDYVAKYVLSTYVKQQEEVQS